MVQLLEDAHTQNVSVIITPGVPYIGAVDDGLQLIFQSIAPYGEAASDLTIAATNGDNYSPRLPAWPTTTDGGIDERKNRLLWSKLDQPEHVPASHELTVGRGEIIRMITTQDRLLVFCTDGLYSITGNEFGWSVDLVDRNIVIPSQHAVDQMKGTVYAYAKDRGLLRIDRSGAVTELTKGAIQTSQIDPLVQTFADELGDYRVHVVCDALHDEVGLFVQPVPVTEEA